MGMNTFSFNAFAGAIFSLGRSLNKTAKTVGLSRPVLAKALQKHYRNRRKEWEAEFWANAWSDNRMGKWVWKQKQGKFDVADEEELIELADRVPSRVREGLTEIAKCLPGRRGGKARVLTMKETWRVRAQVSKEREKGFSKRYAYGKVARKLKVSEHTIRRVCEPKERKYSRKSSS
jgi:hypothetical protein